MQPQLSGSVHGTDAGSNVLITFPPQQNGKNGHHTIDLIGGGSLTRTREEQVAFMRVCRAEADRSAAVDARRFR